MPTRIGNLIPQMVVVVAINYTTLEATLTLRWIGFSTDLGHINSGCAARILYMYRNTYISMYINRYKIETEIVDYFR